MGGCRTSERTSIKTILQDSYKVYWNQITFYCEFVRWFAIYNTGGAYIVEKTIHNKKKTVHELLRNCENMSAPSAALQFLQSFLIQDDTMLSWLPFQWSPPTELSDQSTFFEIPSKPWVYARVTSLILGLNKFAKFFLSPLSIFSVKIRSIYLPSEKPVNLCNL